MSMSLQPTKTLSKPRAAKQSMARETDINYIVAQSTRLGAIPQARTQPPQFIDLAGVPNFHESLNLITRAQQAFAILPAKIRSACNNDIRGYVSLVTDKNRREEAISLGLLKAKTPPTKAEKKPETPHTPDVKPKTDKTLEEKN